MLTRRISVSHCNKRNSNRKFLLSLNNRFLSTFNKEIPQEVDVVVIGGGSIGASTLYHLTELGVNAILLEKHKLTSGTTWHSAGLLWRLRPSDIDIRLIDHTRYLAKKLEKETGISTGWVENGGLFIADNQERLAEYQKLASLGKFFDIDSHILSPNETKDLHPFLNTSDIYGSLHSPGDGILDPSNWVSALIKGAKQKGAQVFENCGVSQVSLKNQKIFSITTSNGERIRTSKVVNCAGAWSPEIGKMVGVEVPLCAMHHAYVVTETIPGIQKMPNIRDHDKSVYIKVQGDTLQVGGYEGNPIFCSPLDGDSPFSLYDLNWEVFSAHIHGAMHRLPVLKDTGIRSTVCGPESFTPDHKALLGESSKVRGFFLGCGFNSAGIMLSGGCGRELANWIVYGSTDIDMFSYDINRFHPSQRKNKKWIKERSHEAYAKNYSIVFPYDEPMACRNLRKDPFHQQMMQHGCIFQERHGWERPGWFSNHDSTRVKEYDFYGNYDIPLNKEYQYLSHIQGDNTFEWGKSHTTIEKEAQTCREKVVCFNQSYFGKFFLEGKDAQEAMNWICTNNVSKGSNTTVYTNMCNDRGGVECDLTVSQLEKSNDGTIKYYITAGGTSATHDWNWIKYCIEEKGFQCQLFDETENYGVLSIQGPYSRALLQDLSKDREEFNDKNFPFSTHRIVRIAGHQVRAIRLTFVGELGWELHIPRVSCLAVYQAIMEHGKKYGICNAGYRAIDSLSIEKGYKHWHEDLRSEDTPIEAGLGFICKLKTNMPFKGREILEEQKRNGVSRILSCFTVDENIPLTGMEPIWRNDTCVGFLRRSDYGYTIKKSIGYGYVHHPNGDILTKEFLSEGNYELEVLNQKKVSAKIHLKPVFDPLNLRIKGEYKKN